MAITNGYITLDELEEWNGAKKAVSKLTRERVISACSRGIDRWCKRHFFQKTEARTIAPDNAYEFAFGPFHDLHAITELATDAAGDGTFETVWSAGDYELLPLNPSAAPERQPYTAIRSTGTRAFPYLSAQPGTTGRSARVRITGTWGWAAIPDAVAQACLIQSARIYKRKDSPEGVAGWGDFGMIRVGQTDPDVIGLLDEYRYGAKVGFVRVR